MTSTNENQARACGHSCLAVQSATALINEGFHSYLHFEDQVAKQPS